MENDAVKDAIHYLEKQKAAIEEALLHLTAVPHEVEAETEEREASKFSEETSRRMSLAHRHRWDLKDLKCKMAAIKRELGGKRVKIDSLPWKRGKG